MGKGASVHFTGKNLATITAVTLDATGAATLGLANGGLTITNQPANMSLLTVFEFLAPTATLTCNSGSSWLCELRMKTDGVFTSSSATTLAGLISGTGAITLPASCSTINSTGSNRGGNNNSVVFSANASFADANIFSSGTLTLLYNLIYTGVGNPPVPVLTKGAPPPTKGLVNKIPCSSVVLGASVTIDGGAGLTITQLTDTGTFYPTLQGALTIGTYNPIGNNVVIPSGNIAVKSMTQPDGTFPVHKASGAIFKIGG